MKLQLTTDNLKLKRADVILLCLSFATAIVDVVTFNDLAVFVANQTGNVIFLSLGAVGITNQFFHPDRSIIALLSFWFGSFISGRLAIRFGGKNRIYLFCTFFFQGLLIILVAVLVLTGILDFNSPESNLPLLIIFPLGAVFGAQAAACRPFGVPAITTVVVTSAMVDLFCDPKLFAPLKANVPRNHRTLFIIIFFAGGTVGGAIVRTNHSGWALILSGGIKLGIGVMMLFLEGETNEIEDAEVARNVEVIVVPIGTTSSVGAQLSDSELTRQNTLDDLNKVAVISNDSS